MGRASNTELLATTVVRLRDAMRHNDRSGLNSVLGDLEERVGEADSLSKTEAARLLEVSVNTLDKWIARDVIPTIKDKRYKRVRIPVQAALRLAEEIAELRRVGYDRGLLAEAISRLEQNDPQWKREFDELYRAGLDSMRNGDLVKLDVDSFGPDD